MQSFRFVLFLTLATVAAAEVRLVRFAEAKPFRMGRVTSNRIIHPEMGASRITLNLSVSNRGDEFAPHVHTESDDTILVLTGAGEMRQGDSKRRVPAGQSIFVPSGQIHGTITTEDNSMMISFQTPPDFVLYTGARDSMKPGAAPPQGVITPGAIKYVDFESRNGLFADRTIGAERIKAAHHEIAPGTELVTEVSSGSEQVLFVWKGSVIANGNIRAGERDTIFARGPARVRVRNGASARAVVIQAQAPPATGNAFAGRWTMQAREPSPKIFWMEIYDTNPATGNLFGTTGGRLATMLDPVIRGDELTFRTERTFDGSPARTARAVTKVRRVGDGIEGSTAIDGGATFPWKGWRPADLPDRDDGRWRDLESIRLFDGDLPDEWQVRDGVISNKSARAPSLVSQQEFSNFRLHVEYRLPKGGNSGIGLRNHYELQLADDHGQPPDVHGNASLYSQIAPRLNASRPAGEWQNLDLTLIGRDLTVVLNGSTVIDHQSIRGLTGMVSDGHEDKAGPIALQGDHGGVEFRGVTVTPLTRGRPDVHDVSYSSAINQRDIRVKVYLPPEYDSGEARYPVVYNLHGAGGGSPERQWDRTRSTLRDAMENGHAAPRIYVFVEGLGDTFFIDSDAGGPKVESSIVNELIPFIDGRYRTIAGREGRAIDGFSMGGFGALMIAFKHPQLFSSVVSYGAALIDADRLRAHHPSAWVERNADRIRSKLAVRMVCGDADRLFPANMKFKEQLERAGIRVEWVPVAGVGHETKGLYQRVGLDSLKFMQSALKE
jgi:enterochelin esterase-like enzyme/quercetin dioxygenase-like cupin family protein